MVITRAEKFLKKKKHDNRDRGIKRCGGLLLCWKEPWGQVREVTESMRYTPENQTQPVKIIAGILMASALISYLFTISGIITTVLPLQTAAMLALVAAIYILVRYLYTSMTYIIQLKSDGITDEEMEAAEICGEISEIPVKMLDFAVMKAQGRRGKAYECILGLELLEETREVKAKGSSFKAELRKEYGGISFYDYTVSMFPSDMLALIFKDGDNTICLITEPDVNMTSILKSAAQRNM